MQILSGEQLVFLPGLDGTGISYEPLAQFIAPDAQVTVVKYSSESLLSYQETIECAAQQVPSSGESIILAESFSCPIAIELIASGKLKAKRLILCATLRPRHQATSSANQPLSSSVNTSNITCR